jgi:predicted  nucleic acid-binding Zn-ribbon protein
MSSIKDLTNIILEIDIELSDVRRQIAKYKSEIANAETKLIALKIDRENAQESLRINKLNISEQTE